MGRRNHMSFPRETVEYQTVVVTIDGTPVTDNVTFSVVPAGNRPNTWQPATIVDNATAFLVTGMTPGVYTVWAKITNTSSTERPVMNCGTFRID
jgi:hypothetical protein